MSAYDAIVVGTGFASSFFLHRWLRGAPGNARVLVLERGPRTPHDRQIAIRRNSTIDHRDTYVAAGDPAKDWWFTIGFGGGSNCWWACTPRMLPSDFQLASRYGVGRDWPVQYDTLEPFYAEAEEIMAVSGPDNTALFPRSRPYPQPPHRFTEPDRLFKARFPDRFFQQPTARARLATGGRNACCANAVCDLCPVDAKFTIENGMAALYADPRVELRLGAEALAVETAAGRASGVLFRQDGAEHSASSDLVALGANAVFNPYLLLRSGIESPFLGRRLHEQAAVYATVHLDGVDNFQGSTSITGHGYMLHDGPHRRERGAVLIETWNKPFFRREPGKWRQVLRLKLIVEDLPLDENRVELSGDDATRPLLRFNRRSAYALDAIRALGNELPRLLAGLPVERIEIDHEPAATEAHVLGSTVMGDDPRDSVVDGTLRHHRLRNLVMLGGSVFPTGAPANPTLTICALSLYAADRL